MQCVFKLLGLGWSCGSLVKVTSSHWGPEFNSRKHKQNKSHAGSSSVSSDSLVIDLKWLRFICFCIDRISCFHSFINYSDSVSKTVIFATFRQQILSLGIVPSVLIPSFFQPPSVLSVGASRIGSWLILPAAFCPNEKIKVHFIILFFPCTDIPPLHFLLPFDNMPWQSLRGRQLLPP